jgi:hypothetical protein
MSLSYAQKINLPIMLWSASTFSPSPTPSSPFVPSPPSPPSPVPSDASETPLIHHPRPLMARPTCGITEQSFRDLCRRSPYTTHKFHEFRPHRTDNDPSSLAPTARQHITWSHSMEHQCFCKECTRCPAHYPMGC